MLSKDNEKDLADIPEEVREDLTIHTVDMIDEVLDLALEPLEAQEAISTPPIWDVDQPVDDLPAVVD